MQTFDSNQFWEMLLNGISLTEFAVYLVLMLMGAYINFALSVADSVKEDTDTPSKFNFWFMIKDNIMRMFLVLCLIYVNIAFFDQLTGGPISPYNAIILGYAFDSMIGRGTRNAKKAGMFKKSREALINKYK